MLDLSLPELGVIGLIALVVLGPERLPNVARFAGLWVRRARAQWYSVKSELERELEAEELKRSLHNVREEAEDFSAQIRAAGEETRKDFESMREALNDARRARPDDTRIGEPVDDGRDDDGRSDDIGSNQGRRDGAHATQGPAPAPVNDTSAQAAADAARRDMNAPDAPPAAAPQPSSDDGQR